MCTNTEIITAWTQKELIKDRLGKISCWLKDNITDTSHRSPNSFQMDTAFSLPVPATKKESPPSFLIKLTIPSIFCRSFDAKALPTCLPLKRRDRYSSTSHLLKIPALRNYDLTTEAAFCLNPRVYCKKTLRRTQDLTLSALQGRAPPLRPRTTLSTILIHAPLRCFEHRL